MAGEITEAYVGQDGEWVPVPLGGEPPRIIEHSSLGGLENDDHPQYILASGDVATGQITVPPPSADTSVVPRKWVESRGSGDLITNGTGLLLSNYNFSLLEFTTADSPPGTVGSFYGPTLSNWAMFTDEAIPVSASNQYLISAQVRQRNTATAADEGFMYLGHTCFDVAGNSIQPYMVLWTQGTSTTLAQELKPGDTKVYLADATNWITGLAPPYYGYVQGIVFWNYTDVTGKVWPAGTYSREAYWNAYSEASTVDNSLTLLTPWTGNTYPVGHPVGNCGSGDTYDYSVAFNIRPPDTWTTYSGVIGGLAPPGTAPPNNLRQGTAYIRFLMLGDRTQTGGTSTASEHALGAVSIRQINYPFLVGGAIDFGGNRGNGLGAPTLVSDLSRWADGIMRFADWADIDTELPLADRQAGMLIYVASTENLNVWSAIRNQWEIPGFSGQLMMWTGVTIPDGWLSCDGQAVSRITWPTLFSVMGTQFGAGDGSTTFNVPNMNGRVPVGHTDLESEFLTPGQTGGEKTHLLNVNEMPDHNHSIHRGADCQTTIGTGSIYNLQFNSGSTVSETQTVGGSQPHNNLQPYITLLFIVKG